MGLLNTLPITNDSVHYKMPQSNVRTIYNLSNHVNLSSIYDTLFISLGRFMVQLCVHTARTFVSCLSQLLSWKLIFTSFFFLCGIDFYWKWMLSDKSQSQRTKRDSSSSRFAGADFVTDLQLWSHCGCVRPSSILFSLKLLANLIFLSLLFISLWV